MAQFDDLKAKIAAAVAQVAATKGVQASAKAALLAQNQILKDAVEAAIKANDDVDNSVIAELHAAMDAATTELTSSTTDLAAAIPQNPGPGEPPPVLAPPTSAS